MELQDADEVRTPESASHPIAEAERDSGSGLRDVLDDQENDMDDEFGLSEHSDVSESENLPEKVEEDEPGAIHSDTQADQEEKSQLLPLPAKSTSSADGCCSRCVPTSHQRPCPCRILSLFRRTSLGTVDKREHVC